jgi:Protein of unknown function (DUF3048) N-terminal domain/Protein of unknown function (DUF3048) C-terminal domain
MSPTRRGRVALGLIIVLALVGGLAAAVVAVGGKGETPSTQGSSSGGPSAGPTGSGSPSSASTEPPPPPICPLTGETDDSVPARPVLAVKVENLPAARPQTGLSWANLVYEEPVEGGITRFIAIYQCHDASRIEPVRSARLTDVNVLLQFPSVLFAYAGGVPKVTSAVKSAGITDVNFNLPRSADAYHRDDNRLAPHNLYTSTKELYAAGQELVAAQAPPPMFTYSKKVAKGATPIAQAHVPFSTSSDVYWKWSASDGKWLRFHGTEPHTLSDGTQVSATNVIIQMVKITTTDVTDANGVASPEAHTIGSGKAYVLRNGKMIEGTWQRGASGDVTTFLTTKGKEIKLAIGNTWIELLPDTITPTFS